MAQEIEIISTGGTAKMLTQAGIDCRDVSELTGFPEMMDGRVKTLHPMVHGGLLRYAIMKPIQTPCATMVLARSICWWSISTRLRRRSGRWAYEACIENIDIGGPAMIRAAAKNHQDVTVIVDPEDYANVLDSLQTHQGTQLVCGKGWRKKPMRVRQLMTRKSQLDGRRA